VSSATEPKRSTPSVNDLELQISGMTCASCANRIERKLNKLEGVTATVNYATEKAKVTVPADLAPEVVVTTVEQAGYGATIPARRRPARARRPRRLRRTPPGRSSSGCWAP
jgi:Cu+-exporting ATPase